MAIARGRGTTGNALSARFDDLARAADGDWLDHHAAHEEPDPLRTTVTAEHPRSIISRNTSPDIPFDRSVNAYRGCEHGCVYCFARPSHAYLNLSPGLDFESRLFAKPDAAALLRAAFARPGYRPEVLAMGTNTDPYQPIERDWRITRQVLELCLEVGHPVSVTTKSARVLDDLALLGRLAERGLAMAMVSVTTLDPVLARRMEPRAAAPAKRMGAVRALAAAGVPTTVSFSPAIPALNCHELEAVAAAAADAGAAALVAMPLRLPHEVAPLFDAWLAAHFPDRRAHVLNAVRDMRGGRLNDPGFGSRFKAQGPWAALLRARLLAARRRHGFAERRWTLRTDLFERPRTAEAARQGMLL